MQFEDILNAKRRPKILLSAVRQACKFYSRDRDLSKIIHTIGRIDSTRLSERLLDKEECLDQARRTGCASYNLSKHIQVLVALVEEIKLIKRSCP